MNSFLLFLFIQVTAAAGNCFINVDNIAEQDAPLFIQDGEFIYPEKLDADGNRVMEIKHGDNIQLQCHASDLDPITLDGMDVDTIIFQCDNGSFLFDGEPVDVHQVICTDNNEPAIVRTPGSSCSDEGADGRLGKLDAITDVSIGWNVNGAFKEQIQFCVDELFYATLWTRHQVIGKSIGMRDTTGGRPSFRRDISKYKRMFSEFNTQGDIETSYTKKQQALTIQSVLGKSTTDTGEDIIETSRSGTHYFARGHLAPDAAFIFNAFQDATYYFVNVAPQFQSFNNGAWKALEGAVRDLAESLSETLEVYTGTYDSLSFTSVSGTEEKIFLYNEDGNTWIPAPLYYWKVVFNPVNNEAVAFVGVNNPHEDQSPVPICTDICSEIVWADWVLTGQESGFMYCCSVEDLQSAINYAPNLNDTTTNTWPALLTGTSEAVEISDTAIPEGACTIDLEQRPEDVVLPFYTSGGQFVYPIFEIEEHRMVVIESGINIGILCHGRAAKLSYIEGITGLIDTEEITLSCNQGSFYLAGQTEAIEVHSLTCTETQWAEIYVTQGEPCSPVGLDGKAIASSDLALIQIGWYIDGYFQKQIEICQDTKSYASLWTSHTLQGVSVGMRDTTAGRPSFKRDVTGFKRMFHGFPTVASLSDSYTKKSQEAQMVKLLETNIQTNADFWIETSSSGTHYFARGHLAPDAAFVYDGLQDATYFFANVAPQWQSFNNGNWRQLEEATRNYAISSKAAVNVYTGTFGLLYLEDLHGENQIIYLYTEDGKKYLPAPLYYWKVLHNPSTNEAVAFVGVNNPYLTASPRMKCSNVCSSITFVDWDVEDLDAGFMYCCKVEDLITQMENLPDLRDGNGNWPELLTE